MYRAGTRVGTRAFGAEAFRGLTLLGMGVFFSALAGCSSLL